MMKYLRPYVGVLVLLLTFGGCASSQEAEDRDARPRRRAAPEASGLNLGLAPASPDARTVQLYPYLDDDNVFENERAREDALPILPLRRAQPRGQLQLEFDLLEDNPRSLSVYFYHADRTWRRDLVASEYLTSFDRDDLFDYTLSQGTQVTYVHYRYAFPNDNIDFRLSGNYILRVTEQGIEDEVLFELPFFVTENATELEMALDAVPLAGQQSPSIAPVALFTPPAGLEGNVFDYNVCFVRGSGYAGARCNDSPSLTQQPALLFDLQPDRAFEPQAGDYVLDLRTLRTGGDVEETDFSSTPYRVTLEPDYARFPATGSEPYLNGQAVVSNVVNDVAEPDIAGEYAEVEFRFVPPDEAPLPGGVMLIGSFNGWAFDLANQLTWNAAQKRYEGTALVKQGLYEYRYTSQNRQTRQVLRNNLPRTTNQYTAFVYFSDVRYHTDRLLAAQSIRTQ